MPTKPKATAKESPVTPTSVRKAMKQALRESLADQGFSRRSNTRDFGTGHYEETWSNGTDDVQLRWKHANMLRIEANEHQQSATREKCEKCGTSTRWAVKVLDRWAVWCGCGN